jgi:DNA-binding CsgD family transcriptional regulator/tetratricopeptide (TPR) repeat protein
MQAPFADPLSGLELLSRALPFVGREAQMQAIRTLLDTVALDQPTGARAVMISGEMGMGKSRLLAEMYLEARGRGFRLLEGRTYESGGMFPYLPFIEALRPVIRSSTTEELRHYVGLVHSQGVPQAIDKHKTRAGAGEVTSLTGTPLVAALARLFPDLPRMLHVTIAPEVLSPDQEKFRLFDAVATILERLALERPVLVGIDNLQWADSGSLELTMYLTVRLHGSYVALAGVTRPPTPSSERTEGADRGVSTAASIAAARALAELVRQGLLLILPLGPLDADAAEQHLHTLLPGTFSAELAQSLLNRAGGNPFFLEELVRTLTLNQLLVLRNGKWRATRTINAEIPESITLAVEQRLQGLSTACRELLRVASLLGRTFTLDVLTEMLEESGEQVQLLINEANRAAVIARAPAAGTHAGEYSSAGTSETASFTSELTPAKGIMTFPIYIFCQGIVQEVLSAEVPTQRARVLHGTIGKALERSYADAAPAHAAELARHYVLSGDRQGALRWSLLAGEDAVRQQAHREAIGHFRTVLRLVEDPSIQAGLPNLGRPLPSPAQLHLLIGESWFKLGELEQAAFAFQQALQDLHEAGTGYTQSLLLAQVNRLLADVYRMQGKYDQTMAHLQAASSAFNAVVETERTTNGQATQVRWFPGRSFPGSTVTLGRTSTSEHILLLQAQATLDMMLGRTQEAEAELWQLHQLATDSGDRGSQAFALQLLGWLRGWGEHIHEAIRFQEQAHTLYVSIGDPFRAALVDQVLGIVYQALGEMEHARLCTLRGFERARRYGARGILGLLYWNQGVMALAQGDWASSDARLQQALQEALANNDARLKPNALLAQAELQFRIGNWPEAEQLFQTSIQAASTTEWIAGATALYGHFLAVTGRRKAAQEQLERAAAIPEPPGLAGNFYIPFLAEGYLHIEAHERAASYIERIRSMRGFMYYGTSVDRILGVVATQAGDWETAEQAFEDGLALCQRANNEPEEAAIYYEQARAALMRSGTITLGKTHVTDHTFARLHDLCYRARELFLRYNMQRAASLVDTVQKGVQELEQRDDTTVAQRVIQKQLANTEYQLTLRLTERELEVLHLVAEGHTDREVAEMLVISPRTVNRHLSNIFVKLDVPGRAAAVAYAIRQGIVL